MFRQLIDSESSTTWWLKLGAVLASQKPFSERMRSTGNAAEVQWQIACENGSLTCTARMTPHFEPLLQSVAIVKTAKTS